MIARRSLVVAAALLPMLRARADEPVMVGVSGPLTGQYAQYGADWKRGSDLAVEQVNKTGGIKGRPLAYDFEDSQSDPRQAVAIAQKFVSNPQIVMELGDFSSAASMAASPIYERGKLVQFGFTNSHPDFTKGGDYMWSNAPNQADDMPMLADYAAKLGLKRVAIAFIDSDWGKTSKDIFVKAAATHGIQVLASQGYLPNDQDFRSMLVRLRDTKPDGLILVSYYPDGAAIMRQMRALDMDQPVVAAGSVFSPKFLELGGSAVNGVYTVTNFFPGDPQPFVQNFVRDYKAKYGSDPGAYAARAYDAMIVAATLLRDYGTTREAVHEGLSKATDIPSVVYGSVRFDPATRRVQNPHMIGVVVQNGQFVLWNAGKS